MRVRNPFYKQDDVVAEAMEIMREWAKGQRGAFRQAYCPDLPSRARSATIEDRARELATSGDWSAEQIAEQIYDEVTGRG